MIELLSLREIKDEGLFHTCGIKNYKGFYRKVSGPTAKYMDFACHNSAYGYPLFKTNKLTKYQIKSGHFGPTKGFLQSAGDTTTSRTGMANH